jgi:magnesium-transporting ATPase (P-type)
VAELPEDLRDLLLKSMLCNDAALNHDQDEWTITGDPTEAALLVAAAKAGFNADEVNNRHPRLDTIPFASENQYMATLHGGEERVVVLKGAPEVVFKRCLQADDAARHQQMAMR